MEHDPKETWRSQLAVTEQALAQAGARPEEIAALGITNQRETAVLWEPRTSQPLHRAIVEQCRRTARTCDRMRAEGFDRAIGEKTGLVTNAYLSSTKIACLLENAPGARERQPRPASPRGHRGSNGDQHEQQGQDFLPVPGPGKKTNVVGR